jgi:hypothetical protein
MSELGDFLEVVFGPNDRFQSIQASLRHWRDRRIAEGARGADRPVIGRRKASSDTSDSIEESALSVWFALPDKMRAEWSRRKNDEVETFLEIVNGDQSWDVDPDGHVETATHERRGAGSLSDVERHFSRRRLRQFFVGLSLELLGNIRAAKQDCIRIRAVPRPKALLWPHWIPSGADEYEFHADASRGLILSIIARYGGEVFEVNEVTDITFDQPLDDSLFCHTPDVGEQIREKDTAIERLTLEAAVSRMPFTVLVPTRLPDPEHSQLEVMHHPSRMRSPRAYFSLMYRGSEVYDSLWIHQGTSPEPDAAKLEWELIIVEGKQIRISDPGVEGKRIVTFEQEGTHVSITSDLAREPLLDLALSFVPASRRPL